MCPGLWDMRYPKEVGSFPHSSVGSCISFCQWCIWFHITGEWQASERVAADRVAWLPLHTHSGASTHTHTHTHSICTGSSTAWPQATGLCHPPRSAYVWGKSGTRILLLAQLLLRAKTKENNEHSVRRFFGGSLLICRIELHELESLYFSLSWLLGTLLKICILGRWCLLVIFILFYLSAKIPVSLRLKAFNWQRHFSLWTVCREGSRF